MSAEFSPKQVRRMFFDREGQRCFFCRRVLSFSMRGQIGPGGWSVHHRKGRYPGGDGYANGLVLCGTGTTGCHGRVTDNPVWAYDLGLSIRRLAVSAEFMPDAVPVTDAAGRKFMLTLDGRARSVEIAS